MLPDWEIWLDDHISPVIAKWLKEKFKLRVKSAYSLQTKMTSDFELYTKAKKLVILSSSQKIQIYKKLLMSLTLRLN